MLNVPYPMPNVPFLVERSNAARRFCLAFSKRQRRQSMMELMDNGNNNNNDNNNNNNNDNNKHAYAIATE
jgi:hypothetical protein